MCCWAPRIPCPTPAWLNFIPHCHHYHHHHHHHHHHPSALSSSPCIIDKASSRLHLPGSSHLISLHHFPLSENLFGQQETAICTWQCWREAIKNCGIPMLIFQVCWHGSEWFMIKMLFHLTQLISANNDHTRVNNWIMIDWGRGWL